MPSIDVSVVVPCYNTEKYLEQALLSALQNDRCSLELIVLNDGSTDGSLAIMRRLAESDARIRVIDKPNQGYGATVNRGIAEAAGEYVTVLEPDDWVQPHMYDHLFELARKTGGPDIVKGAFWRVADCETPDEHLEPCWFHDRIYVKPETRFVISEDPTLLRHHPSIWSAIYRRAFLEEKEIRFMEVPGAGWVDNPYLFETLCQAKSIVYDNEMFYCYREFLPGSSSDIKLSTLPFVRWHDQANILERLGIADDGIWDALYIRIFDCIVPQVELGALNDAEVGPAIEGVCARMDAERVRRLPVVPPDWKETYFRIRGLPVPKDLRAVFVRARIADFARTFSFYGPKVFAQRIGAFVGRVAHGEQPAI